MAVQNNLGKVFEQLNAKTNLPSNAFEKANSMRQEGYAVFQEVLKHNDDALIGYIAEEYFKKYTNHVVQKSVDNFTAETAKLLKMRDKPIDLSNWTSFLPGPKDIAHEPYSKQYVDCNCIEINETDFLNLQISNEERRVQQSAPKKINEETLKNYSKNESTRNVPHTEDIRPYLKRPYQETISSDSNPSKISPNNLLSLPKCYQIDPNRPSTSATIISSSSRTKSFVDSEQNNLKVVNVPFRTARDELMVQKSKKFGGTNPSNQQPLFAYGTSKKSLGARRSVKDNFVAPIIVDQQQQESERQVYDKRANFEEPIDERLKNIDPKMIELISNEIMHKFKPIDWSDIAGLDYAKGTIREAVVWPILRPDIFKGLRRPPRGILLFGPPGTGKTLIGKCIASQSKSTFFSISASSLTSKWIGDGEKMVRALFAVAAVHQPAVIFIDEIDSLLCQRSETEHESSRRLKTEFLVQLDGATTSEDERILIVGATNRPHELDEAARRRLVRRLYIPLPELEARIEILKKLLKSVSNNLIEQQIYEVGKLTKGYSGADMECLCREASMEPIRSIPQDEIPFFNESEVRPINFDDFRSALVRVRCSVSQNDLQQYTVWNETYGSGNAR